MEQAFLTSLPIDMFELTLISSDDCSPDGNLSRILDFFVVLKNFRSFGSQISDPQERSHCSGVSHRWPRWCLAAGVTLSPGMKPVCLVPSLNYYTTLWVMSWVLCDQAVLFTASHPGYTIELPPLCFIFWISDCRLMDSAQFQPVDIHVLFDWHDALRSFKCEYP